MYEISPYATFSVSGGRTTSNTTKTPTRGVTTSTLDYTVQFKTFGHPEGENLNATAYPVLPTAGFGHVKGKSSWHKQRFFSADGIVHFLQHFSEEKKIYKTNNGIFNFQIDESTLSKSMTLAAGTSQLQSHRNKANRNVGNDSRLTSRSSSHNEKPQNGSESDTSCSPTNEFSNTPTYRIPTKSTRGK